jgi:hypothetical protein
MAIQAVLEAPSVQLKPKPVSFTKALMAAAPAVPAALPESSGAPALWQSVFWGDRVLLCVWILAFGIMALLNLYDLFVGSFRWFFLQ